MEGERQQGTSRALVRGRAVKISALQMNRLYPNYLSPSVFCFLCQWSFPAGWSWWPRNALASMAFPLAAPGAAGSCGEAFQHERVISSIGGALKSRKGPHRHPGRHKLLRRACNIGRQHRRNDGRRHRQRDTGCSGVQAASH